MEIALIGAGFSGWAICWHLLQMAKAPIQITVFDSDDPKKCASNMAAGLLHPFAGAHAKLNWKGKIAYQEALQLLTIAEEAIGQPIMDCSGILRIALDEEQALDYTRCAEKEAEVKWCDAPLCQELAPGAAFHPGILIKTGLSVNCSLYLQGLKQACLNHGAQFARQAIHQLNTLNHFDRIIVATGAEVNHFAELSHLPVKPIKGQLLQLAWPKDLPPLPLTVNSYVYLVMDASQNSCWIGSTYEKAFSTLNPEPNIAKALLLPKVEKLFPVLRSAKILDCKAGVRATTPNHLPIFGQINPKVWYLSGMGSKGLLYHSLFASELVKKMLAAL